MKRSLLVLLLVSLSSVEVSAQDLSVTPDDVRIEQSLDGGYLLYVKKKPDIGSILITESTEDPNRKVATYALRDPDYHAENGDEKRMLDGEFLDNSKDLYSLIDSTPMADKSFGRAFRVFIPYIVVWGYPWGRSGETMVLDGTYLSIRAFSKPYGDYTGSYQDNPFVLRVTQAPMKGPPEGNFMPDTVRDFTDIAKEGDGKVSFSPGEADIVNKIVQAIQEETGDSLDMVVALDTTQSMENDVPFIKENLMPLVKKETARFKSFRIGLVYYRDYLEEYLTRAVPFEDNLDIIQRAVDGIRVAGGRDIPEAVYEALYTAVTAYPWAAASRLVMLIGDAPPHPRPRGGVTREMVMAEAKKRNVRIDTVILPQ